MGLINYFKETKAEMTHVSWPTRTQSIAYTTLVLLISLSIAVYTGLLDWAVAEILRVIAL